MYAKTPAAWKPLGREKSAIALLENAESRSDTKT
jgi:hypothetical protein